MIGTLIWNILFLGAIMLFIVGYRKYISSLELSGIILFAILIICHFLVPRIFGSINVQMYFLNNVIGLIMLIVFIILRINKKIICQSCGEKMRRRAKFCRKCGAVVKKNKM